MTQNFSAMAWDGERVDCELHNIMIRIHEQCVEHGRCEDGYVDYMKGANVAGFLKVATAMVEQGVV